MYIAHDKRPLELKTLTDLFSTRIGASLLKSRALKALLPELKDAHHIGLTWKEIWEALKECGYAGSYRQFAAMIRKLASPDQKSRRFTKNPPLHSWRKRDQNLSPQLALQQVVTRRNLNGKYRESRKWRDWIAKRN